MKMRAFAAMSFLLGAGVAATTLIACSSDDDPTPAVLTSGTTTVHVSAASGGTVSDADGKATLTIPPGALAEDTDVTIAVSGALNGSVTSVFELGPNGLQFLKPVALALKLDGVTVPDGKSAALALLEGTTWTALDGSKREGGSVTAEIAHFSKYSVILVDASPSERDAGADADAGEGDAELGKDASSEEDAGDGGPESDASTEEDAGDAEPGSDGATEDEGGHVGAGDMSDLCIGENHACVLMGGEVVCWGDNGSGDLGRTTGSSHNVPPGKVPGMTGVTRIACGGSGATNTCALLADGTVTCWGKNGYGQLGNGELTSGSKGPTAVTGVEGATQLALGTSHACALLTGGSVKCWGNNTYGQLGDGETHSAECVVSGGIEGAPTPDCSASPVTVALEGKATRIAAGGANTCAVLDTGSVQCWGAGQSGQLGNGQTADAKTPATVSDVSSAAGVAVGSGVACAWTAAGEAKCWGAGGAVGDGQATHSTCDGLYGSKLDCATSPVTLAASSIASIGQGARCAVKTDGSAVCWGGNDMGQAGTGATSNSALTTPAAVVSLSEVAQIAAGGNFTCARTTAGEALCWGWNDSRKLGSGDGGEKVATPTPVEL